MTTTTELTAFASTIYIAVTTLVILLFYRFLFGRGNTPPGPWGLPLVGYLPFLTRRPYIKLHELKKTYGPVFSLKIGTKYVIALCDYQSIKEAFSQDAFMGRPTDLAFNLNEATIETGAITGLNWKAHRKFSLQNLRDLGFGKTRMEQHIQEEICEVLELLKKEINRPFLPRKILTPSMSNNISSLVFGRRMKYNDPDRMKLDGLLSEISTFAGSVAILIFLPWLKPIFTIFKIGNQNRLNQALKSFKEFSGKEIIEHKKTLDPNNVRDLMDAFLLEAEKRKTDPESTFLEPVLQDIIGALFGAGSVTVRITTDWLLLLAAAHQDIQRKVQNEIDNAIGRDVFPTRADYKRMPYTEAVIMELMRWRTILPFDISRYTLENTQLNSYTIPKHSYVSTNLWAVHHEKSLWGEDVDVFRPERFLSDDGKEIVKPEYFIPFSVGKRSCLGETLAKVEVFLYFTAILQKFKVKLPSGAKPNFDGQLGIALDVIPQELIFELRD